MKEDGEALALAADAAFGSAAVLGLAGVLLVVGNPPPPPASPPVRMEDLLEAASPPPLSTPAVSLVWRAPF